MNKVKKIFSVVKRELIKTIAYLDTDLYIRLYTNYLKNLGINFTGKDKEIKYIAPSVFFDGTDYTLISLGDNVTVSREVLFLTHDYSLNTAFCAIGERINRHEGEVKFVRKIEVGNDTFIGARVMILPGTKVGNNCIVGACTVLKGIIPDNSVVIGNPCQIIGKTSEYAERHKEIKDYDIE